MSRPRGDRWKVDYSLHPLPGDSFQWTGEYDNEEQRLSRMPGMEMEEAPVQLREDPGLPMVEDMGPPVDSLPLRTERRPSSGGRGRILTAQQEMAIVDMVVTQNDIRLRDIQQNILGNNETFQGAETISTTTIAHILKRHQISMKQIYLVPFQGNEDRVKALRREYVQRMMELDAGVNHHEFIYMDEAGFNLAKRRRRGRNVIGQRATS
ncbi:uncharacterized protein LOC131731437 [Acipenser ruthenus]|uniref:uncharacterized protein LOC131731437 n=1 Tax=Acipenser ruthenus TaxID=7906 RepID=UPI002740C03A|nr:uncharacterized protein LOC131731437 [Acipenser ruthenus]